MTSALNRCVQSWLRPSKALRRRRRHSGIALEPAPHDVVVELLGPQHPGQALAHHGSPVVAQGVRNDAGIERVGFRPARRDHLVDGRAPGRDVRRQANGYNRGASGRNQHGVVRRSLRADARRVHRAGPPVHDGVVDAVLEVLAWRVDAVEPRDVGLVVGDQHWRRRLARLCFEGHDPWPISARPKRQHRRVRPRNRRAQAGPIGMQIPHPCIAEPDRGQHVERRGLGPVIGHGDAHHDVFGVGLGVLDEDVEVAVLVEDAGVHELELLLVAPASPVLLDEGFVGERRLRILVKHPHVRVGWRGVQVEVVLLDVLAVVALVAGQAEQPLLQNGIAPVPQGERQADLLVAIREARQAVFVPAIRARSRVVVGQVVPHGARRAVVFADRAPGAVTDVRPPAFPVHRSRPVFVQAALFHIRQVSHRQLRSGTAVSGPPKTACGRCAGRPAPARWPARRGTARPNRCAPAPRARGRHGARTSRRFR